MRFGEEFPAKYDLSSLRVLGSVGEPINPEAWLWFHKNVGKGQCPIVDTWWQTETGQFMIGHGAELSGQTGQPGQTVSRHRSPMSWIKRAIRSQTAKAAFW